MHDFGDAIHSFTGNFDFLSNFYTCKIVYENEKYRSSEHAFQAAKTDDPLQIEKIKKATAGQSKRLGRQASLRHDWEEKKDYIMLDILRYKFRANPKLKEKLIATYPKELIEGNNWGDKYWGVDIETGNGLNKLGKILMKVREELVSEKNNAKI